MPPPRVDGEAVQQEDFVPSSEATSSSASSTTPGKQGGTAVHEEERQTSYKNRRPSASAQLRNPFVGKTEEDVLDDVDAFVENKGLQDERETFRKGALLARVSQRVDGFESVKQLSEEEKDLLRHEISHRWSQPFMLYFLVVLCAGSAIVQGMDQTAVNGENVHLTHHSSH